MSDDLTKARQEDHNGELTFSERERLAEIGYVARKLSEHYQEMVKYYKTYEHLSSADAIAKTDEAPNEAYKALLRTMPLNQFSWFNLNSLESEFKVTLWEEIKETARDEVLSGTYAFSK